MSTVDHSRRFERAPTPGTAMLFVGVGTGYMQPRVTGLRQPASVPLAMPGQIPTTIAFLMPCHLSSMRVYFDKGMYSTWCTPCLSDTMNHLNHVHHMHVSFSNGKHFFQFLMLIEDILHLVYSVPPIHTVKSGHRGRIKPRF